MKKLYYLFFAFLLLAGCYDDKGNYDYRTLEEVEITLPEETYSLHFGEALRIVPTITTSIPETDLRYDWELYADTLDTYWSQYISIFEGKDLDYVCEQDEVLFPREATYDFRLNVTQLSSGRHFYSDVVEVSLIGTPSRYGALVLHGDGTSTDVGLIEAGEFLLTAPSSPVTPQVIPHYYSEANGGVAIEGTGWKVMQAYSSWGSSYPDNIVIVALTDQSSAVINSKDMTKRGEWNDLFAGGLNQGEPQFSELFGDSGDWYVMDGGDIFLKQYMRTSFTTPMFVARDHEYDFFPGIWTPANGSFQGVFFDRNARGFVGLAYMSVMQFYGFSLIDATEAGPVTGIPFNPADMRADLIYMETGGSGSHHIAVMRDDAGNYFLAELDFTAGSNAEVPRYRYDLSNVADAQAGNVVDWAFGSSYINMAYYATASGVYQFAVDAGNAISPEELRTQANEVVEFDGEITYMEILKPNVGGGYYMSNLEMVVGTYGGTTGSGKLYSMEIEPFSGRVISSNVYEGFDRIYDVDLKGY